MAIGKASDFKIYQEYLRTRISELLTQFGEVFGAATNNALRVTTESKRGDYQYASFFQNVTGLVSRRDNTSTSSVTDLALTQEELISVKLSRKIGPVAQTRDAFRKAVGNYTETEFTGILAEQAANAMQIDMLNIALGALVAALKQQSASYYTEASLGSISTQTLTGMLNLMGDRAARVVAFVMHSKPYWNLVNNQIGANITGISNFNIQTGAPVTLNRPVVVTDSSDLIQNLNSPDVNNYMTLALVTDAAVVENTETEEIVVQDVTGLETLAVRYQGEYAFNLGLKGFKWDVTNGGANPLSTAVKTGTNWDTAYASVKDRAGVVGMTL